MSGIFVFCCCCCVVVVVVVVLLLLFLVVLKAKVTDMTKIKELGGRGGGVDRGPPKVISSLCFCAMTSTGPVRLHDLHKIYTPSRRLYLPQTVVFCAYATCQH